VGQHPPFNLLRAAFLLLAAVIVVQLAASLLGLGGCFWLVVSKQYQLGACSNVTAQIREVWSEMLAAVLALLLAGKGDRP
jgi:hypothetical protein